MSEEYVSRQYFDEQMKELKALIVSQVVHPDWVSITEACKLLGKSRSTVNRLIAEGKIVAEQVSLRKKRISYASIMALKKLI